MANKTTGGLTEAGTITGDELLALVQGGDSVQASINDIAAALAGIVSAQTYAMPFRGAMVGIAADTPENSITFPYIPSWDSVDYDTDSFHNGGDPTKLTIPTNVTKVRFIAQVAMESNLQPLGFYMNMLKNGSTAFRGNPERSFRLSGDGYSNNTFQVVSPVLEVAAGDEFELRLNATTSDEGYLDTMKSEGTFFNVEVVEAAAQT